MKKDKDQDIVKLFRQRAVLKQDIFELTTQKFQLFKQVLEEEVNCLKKEVENEKVRFIFQDSGKYEARVTLGGDTILFHMHTNVFKFDDQNALLKTSYVKENPDRAYCGVINIYNFLADSFLYNRINDQGYLIGRVFVNMEGHYVVEGKGLLAYAHRDFINAVFDNAEMKKLIRNTLAYSINFELLIPPYETMQIVSVAEMMELSSNLQLQTGKRLGFKFRYNQKD